MKEELIAKIESLPKHETLFDLELVRLEDVLELIRASTFSVGIDQSQLEKAFYAGRVGLNSDYTFKYDSYEDYKDNLI